MEIIYKKVDELKPYDNNPRINKEAIPKVAESISLFGFRNPIIIDTNNVIICGHTRYFAAKSLELQEIPCTIISDLTQEQINAFRIIDNKTNEFSKWDEEKLKEELEKLPVDLIQGFDFPDFFNTEVIDDEFDADKEIDKIIVPSTKPGEIYKLGPHYLMCGDSTKFEDIEKLHSTANIISKHEGLVDLILTDPPYNVDVHNAAGLNIKNDNLKQDDFKQLLVQAFNNMSKILKGGGAFYIWHAESNSTVFREACETAGLKIRQCLIWAKNHFVIGRQDYQWKHEPCLYGWKEGGSHYFIDDRTQSTILKEDEIDFNKLKKEELKEMLQEMISNTKSTIIEENKPANCTEHPTMKPVKLMARLIANSTRIGEWVLDNFAGSGATLIAADQLKRTALLMEIDPKYCDVIIKRYEESTGIKAEKICES